jgi:two-component system NtrC family sensor kinase
VAEGTGSAGKQSFAVTLLVERTWWLFLLAVVACFAFWSLSENVQKIKDQHTRTVTESARNIFRLVELTRFWNASHGGVYVPVTDNTPPNPYLTIPDRDLTTMDGRKLTMVNPAYMTRQMSELLAAQSSYSFHITSLKPIRPANRADEWETLALQQFEQGVAEVSEKLVFNGNEIFRYMAPLVVKPACLKCHAAQGYITGDIRGGISVTFNGGDFINESNDLVMYEAIKHAVIFLVFALVFLLLINKVRAQYLFMQDSVEKVPVMTEKWDNQGSTINYRYKNHDGPASSAAKQPVLRLLP